MAADLYIHVLDAPGKEVSEDDLALFHSNSMGSKHFNMDRWQEHNSRFRDLYLLMSETPQIHVGEVSWLKAALFGDSETYVPKPVEIVSEAIGEDLPVVDDELIEKIRSAFGKTNQTSYQVSRGNDVLEFLETHRGRRVFTVSW